MTEVALHGVAACAPNFHCCVCSSADSCLDIVLLCCPHQAVSRTARLPAKTSNLNTFGSADNGAVYLALLPPHQALSKGRQDCQQRVPGLYLEPAGLLTVVLPCTVCCCRIRRCPRTAKQPLESSKLNLLNLQIC
jgi:hypothetical protein